jgi:putative addiction module component (TIGR02574 family)
MAKSRQPSRRDSLSTAKKILDLQDRWDDIAATPDDIELTPAQRRELDRRVKAHAASPGASSPWSRVRRQVRAKR